MSPTASGTATGGCFQEELAAMSTTNTGAMMILPTATAGEEDPLNGAIPEEHFIYPSHVICHEDPALFHQGTARGAAAGTKTNWRGSLRPRRDFCWDLAQKGYCPRGAACTWDHGEYGYYNANAGGRGAKAGKQGASKGYMEKNSNYWSSSKPGKSKGNSYHGFPPGKPKGNYLQKGTSNSTSSHASGKGKGNYSSNLKAARGSSGEVDEKSTSKPAAGGHGGAALDESSGVLEASLTCCAAGPDEFGFLTPPPPPPPVAVAAGAPRAATSGSKEPEPPSTSTATSSCGSELQPCQVVEEAKIDEKQEQPQPANRSRRSMSSLALSRQKLDTLLLKNRKQKQRTATGTDATSSSAKQLLCAGSSCATKLPFLDSTSSEDIAKKAATDETEAPPAPAEKDLHAEGNAEDLSLTGRELQSGSTATSTALVPVGNQRNHHKGSGATSKGGAGPPGNYGYYGKNSSFPWGGGMVPPPWAGGQMMPAWMLHQLLHPQYLQMGGPGGKAFGNKGLSTSSWGSSRTTSKGGAAPAGKFRENGFFDHQLPQSRVPGPWVAGPGGGFGYYAGGKGAAHHTGRQRRTRAGSDGDMMNKLLHKKMKLMSAAEKQSPKLEDEKHNKQAPKEQELEEEKNSPGTENTEKRPIAADLPEEQEPATVTTPTDSQTWEEEQRASYLKYRRAEQKRRFLRDLVRLKRSKKASLLEGGWKTKKVVVAGDLRVGDAETTPSNTGTTKRSRSAAGDTDSDRKKKPRLKEGDETMLKEGLRENNNSPAGGVDEKDEIGHAPKDAGGGNRGRREQDVGGTSSWGYWHPSGWGDAARSGGGWRGYGYPGSYIPAYNYAGSRAYGCWNGRGGGANYGGAGGRGGRSFYDRKRDNVGEAGAVSEDVVLGEDINQRDEAETGEARASGRDGCLLGENSIDKNVDAVLDEPAAAAGATPLVENKMIESAASAPEQDVVVPEDVDVGGGSAAAASTKLPAESSVTVVHAVPRRNREKQLAAKFQIPPKMTTRTRAPTTSACSGAAPSTTSDPDPSLLKEENSAAKEKDAEEADLAADVVVTTNPLKSQLFMDFGSVEPVYVKELSTTPKNNTSSSASGSFAFDECTPLPKPKELSTTPPAKASNANKNKCFSSSTSKFSSSSSLEQSKLESTGMLNTTVGSFLDLGEEEGSALLNTTALLSGDDDSLLVGGGDSDLHDGSAAEQKLVAGEGASGASTTILAGGAVGNIAVAGTAITNEGPTSDDVHFTLQSPNLSKSCAKQARAAGEQLPEGASVKDDEADGEIVVEKAAAEEQDDEQSTSTTAKGKGKKVKGACSKGPSTSKGGSYKGGQTKASSGATSSSTYDGSYSSYSAAAMHQYYYDPYGLHQWYYGCPPNPAYGICGVHYLPGGPYGYNYNNGFVAGSTGGGAGGKNKGKNVLQPGNSGGKGNIKGSGNGKGKQKQNYPSEEAEQEEKQNTEGTDEVGATAASGTAAARDTAAASGTAHPDDRHSTSPRRRSRGKGDQDVEDRPSSLPRPKKKSADFHALLPPHEVERRKAPLVGPPDPLHDAAKKVVHLQLEKNDFLQNACSLRKEDFDFRVKRFLYGLCERRGEEKLGKCLQMLEQQIGWKGREEVANWSAYVYGLLKKFDPELFGH